MKLSFTEVMKWTASIAAYVSAILVSFSIHLAMQPYTFVGFLVGHIIWGIISWKMREYALVGLNIGFIPIDVYAILIRL